MEKMILHRLEDIFTKLKKEISVLNSTPMETLGNATKEKKLEIGTRIENLRFLNVQFNVLAQIITEDIGQELTPEQKEYYDLQNRAKNNIIPEDDENMINFKKQLINIK
jgi:hypothetical protein